MHRHLLAAAALLVVASCANHLPDQDLRILTAQPAAKLSASDLWKDFQADARPRNPATSERPWTSAMHPPRSSRMPRPALAWYSSRPGSEASSRVLLDERATATVAEAKAGVR
jgi:hypothetical protein